MMNLKALLKRRVFQADERGNVALMVAAAAVPLTLGGMGALDLTHSMTAKVELQDALDAAALAVGRSTATDPTQLQAIGQQVLTQNLAGSHDVTVTSSSFTIGANNVIDASAQATFQASLTGMFGSSFSTISASAEVTRASDILEVAMVLDNTGSMNDPLGSGSQQSKISYLRTAAANFVTSMATAAAQSATPNSVRISLVPFANTVNVGSTYAKATWIDQNGVSPINNEIFTTAQGVTQSANRFTLFANLKTSWGGCVEMRQAPYDVQDTAPTTSTPATLFTPFFAPDEIDGVNTRQNPTAVNDYVTDPAPKKNSRGQITSTWWYEQGDIAKYSTRPKVTLSTSLGPNAGCTMQALQRLTTDFTGLKTAINQMVAGGDTNIPLGLMWGWHTLSPNAPFADGVAYNTPKHKKIAVLMTDGQDTMTANPYNNDNSYYSGAGYVWQGRVLEADGSTHLNSINSSSDDRTAALDSRLQLICANMKADNIEIYTVGVGVTTASKALLQSCASGSDHYFDVSAGSDLNSTFQSIANSIAQLHLSK